MSSKKEVTIGITVNLDNYENLRLEVEGDVETGKDVDDLIEFLDGMLVRFGRGDPATAERVDTYRRRVLAAGPAGQQAKIEKPVPEVKEPEPAAPVVPETEAVNACLSPEVIESAIPPAPEHPVPPRTSPPPVKQEETVSGKPVEEPVQVSPQASSQQEPVTSQEPAAVTPPAALEEGICEMCGAEVTKAQEKLSRLFMNKTLCKKCMEQP